MRYEGVTLTDYQKAEEALRLARFDTYSVSPEEKARRELRILRSNQAVWEDERLSSERKRQRLEREEQMDTLTEAELLTATEELAKRVNVDRTHPLTFTTWPGQPRPQSPSAKIVEH